MFNDNRGKRGNSRGKRRRPSKPKRLNDKDEDFIKIKDWSEKINYKSLQAVTDMLTAQQTRRSRNQNNSPAAGPSGNSAPAGFLASALPDLSTAAAAPVIAPMEVLNTAAPLAALADTFVAAESLVAMSTTPAAASDMTENIRPKQEMANVINQIQGPALNNGAPNNYLAAPVILPQKDKPSKTWELFVPRAVKEDDAEIQIQGHNIYKRDDYLVNRCQRMVGLTKNNVEPR
ncbi:MAG: hypothetical protein GY779_06845, partial [Gammaproteobacteria bacterium]|nr:hypothetical protein [Gammaproteobacteria bacterium]